MSRGTAERKLPGQAPEKSGGLSPLASRRVKRNRRLKPLALERSGKNIAIIAYCAFRLRRYSLVRQEGGANNRFDLLKFIPLR